MSVCFPKRWKRVSPSTNLPYSGWRTSWFPASRASLLHATAVKCVVLLLHTLWLKARCVKIKTAFTKGSDDNYSFLPSAAWPMRAEGVFKEALLFCLLIESLLESHSWINLAGQSGKAWWDVARPICSAEFWGWMGLQICHCPAKIYLSALPLCTQIIHSFIQE